MYALERTVGRRTAALVLLDLLAWTAGTVSFGLMRVGPYALDWAATLAVGLLMGVAFVAVGVLVRLHQGRARIGSLEDVLLMGEVALVVGAAGFLVDLLPVWIPRSVPLGATCVFLVLAGAARMAWRLGREPFRSDRTETGDRVLVVGAGDAAHDLVPSMLRDPRRTWTPVALVDDDPAVRHRRIRNVPVIGSTHDLADKIQRVGATAVVVAITAADRELLGRIQGEADEVDVPVKVLPSTSELLHDHVGIRDLRDINLHDVLGRSPIDTDLDAIAHYLGGKRVLVTGAGGSIGSELCRQISRFEPAALMMLDRDESALHGVQLTIAGHGLLDTDDTILCDIRDAATVQAVFDARRPHVVFHAAALKHLPMLEQYPAEAVKTNVDGTWHVLEAARRTGVERFVNISTDKAANPSSVLGWSKRVAERITAHHAAEDRDGTYLSVRFGNVLGSRGSVLTSFAQQIARGGPVTVTDPDVTRYFMMIEEACELVIQAAAIGAPGEALVLDMGEPVRILDVAHRLIRESGRPIRVQLTGLRPGEKLHEDLFADDEPRGHRPRHPLVSHVPVPPLGPDEVARLPRCGPRQGVQAALAELCEATRLRVPTDDGVPEGEPGGLWSGSPGQAL